MPQPPTPSPQPPHIILASSSPRRRELLREAGYSFTVMPAAEDVECGVCSESGPAGLVAELAYRKAMAVWRQLQSENSRESISDGTVVLAADTVAECDGFILGKPRDEDDARKMLKQLSGREHRVLTGVCVMTAKRSVFPPLPQGEGRGEGALKRRKPLPTDLVEFARNLRKNQTDAEQLTWSLLRDRRFAGFKFRRQHPIGRYVLDFYCQEYAIVIELDGGQHNTEQGRFKDKARSRFLEERGIQVLRFWNHEVLQDTDDVLEAIWSSLQNRCTLTPSSSPKGRGEPNIRVAVTKLRMDLLTDRQLDEYIESGQWEGKAGAFGYQDRLGWVHVVEGSESNVVGLPMELVAEMLQEVAKSED